MPKLLTQAEAIRLTKYLKNDNKFPFLTGSLKEKTQFAQMTPKGFEVWIGTPGTTSAGREPSTYVSYLEYSKSSKHKGWIYKRLMSYAKDMEKRFNTQGDDEEDV